MSELPYKPYVPPDREMTEFTLRALILGILMCVVLGAANAYLGLRAGMTIAATYPAAVISMAVLRFFKGSLLEENFARTVGSIGESVAAGAIFTIPAFVMLQLWSFKEFSAKEYLTASALMIVGGILGILFVTILRRPMVEDRTLPFPESVAAGEIHKAGQRGAEAAMQLFKAMGVGAVVQLLGMVGIFRASNILTLKLGLPAAVGKAGSAVKLGIAQGAAQIRAWGTTNVSWPAVSPAYFGVGFIIGPELGALNFAGGLLAWGLFVPLLVYFLGPGLIGQYTTVGADGQAVENWAALAQNIWLFVVRPIAVGGMLVSALYTLYRIRKNLLAGIKRGVADVRKSAGSQEVSSRIERDLNFKVVLGGLVAVFLVMCALYAYFTGVIGGAIAAAVVMLITGFFFAAVSGNLVGLIGSSNNPISGLTLATLIVAAGTMLIIGVTGPQGVVAVLGIAAVVCVSSAVAGEMLQDLKVGHILGGTPWKMQVGDVIGVVIAGLVMFFPLFVLHNSNRLQGGIGFGDTALSAPQAGLMATLSQGIIGGEMAWPLVVTGMAMGVSLILIRVKSPMLFSVGMYLPLETTFAIFVGGAIRGIVDMISKRRGHNDAQKARVENSGILAASGLIAGEALMGLLIAAIVFWRGPEWNAPILNLLPGGWPVGFLAIVFAIGLLAYLIFVPLRKAGSPDEPAPPTAMM